MLDFRCNQRFGLVSDSLITNTNRITSRSVGRIKNQNNFINSDKERFVTSKIKWGNIPKIIAKIAKG